MSAQALFLAHVEKLVVLVVLAICALSLYGTYTNQETQSKVTLQQLQTDTFRKIEEAADKGGSPNLLPPRRFDENLRVRLGQKPSPGNSIAWLHKHPDIGPDRSTITAADVRLFIYEVGRPEVRVVDEIGRLRVTVTPPASRRKQVDPKDPFKDSPSGVLWHREERDHGSVDNQARWAGMYVEFKLDEGEWKPFVTPSSPGGMVSLAGGGSELVLDKAEAWAEYSFRARVLVEATAVGDLTKREIGREVVIPLTPIPVADDAMMTDLQLETIRQSIEAGKIGLAQPFSGAGLPGVGDMAKGQVFGAVACEPEVIRAQSPIRMALDRVTENMDGTFEARLLLKKLIKDENGKVLGWTEQQRYTVPVNGRIGSRVNVRNVPGFEGRVWPVDFTTPFVLESVERDIARILYWEVRDRNVQDGEGGEFVKQLVLEKEEKEVDAVVLRNTKTKGTLRLNELSVIRPTRPDVFTYPEIPEDGVNEKTLFDERPMEFEIKGDPKQPTLHTDKKLLRTLLLEVEAEAASLPYIEMPDGRVVYYYPLERQVHMTVIPGSEYDRRGTVTSGPVDQPGDMAPQGEDGPGDLDADGEAQRELERRRREQM